MPIKVVFSPNLSMLIPASGAPITAATTQTAAMFKPENAALPPSSRAYCSEVGITTVFTTISMKYEIMASHKLGKWWMPELGGMVVGGSVGVYVASAVVVAVVGVGVGGREVAEEEDTVFVNELPCSRIIDFQKRLIS